MCFTFSNFHTNIRGRPGELLISEMRTKTDTSPFVTIDLLSRESAFRYGAEPAAPETRTIAKIVPVHQAVMRAEDDGAETRHVPPPAEVPRPEPPRRAAPEIIQIGYSRMPQRMGTQAFEFDQVSQDMIEDKVAVVARKTVALLADNAKNELNSQAIEVQRTVEEVVSKIEGKIDRDFVERMFNKFRIMLNDINEKIENIQCSFLEWVTRDELELVLQKFLGVVRDVNDAAGTKVKFNCLLCGRPRAHLAGMSFADIVDDGEVGVGRPKPKNKGTPSDFSRQERTAESKRVPRDVVQFLTMQ
jgi:hypothetical protein